jgi:hypothetical protein
MFIFLSELNTQPVRTPINASAPASPLMPHDSRPVWLAKPSPQGFCIPTTLPILIGASQFQRSDNHIKGRASNKKAYRFIYAA